MKHLKTYRIFESVIIPNKINYHPKELEKKNFKLWCKERGIDVVSYNEFYESLSDEDKKTAPPKNGPPYFALFHPIRKRPMFVFTKPASKQTLESPMFINQFNNIIEHEFVHAEQSKRRGKIEYTLPSPLDIKAYFSNKDEIMAFSYTIANDLIQHNHIKHGLTAEDAIKNMTRHIMWKEISKCDEEVKNRYKKYIYMYLKQLLNKEETDDIHSKINKK